MLAHGSRRLTLSGHRRAHHVVGGLLSCQRRANHDCSAGECAKPASLPALMDKRGLNNGQAEAHEDNESVDKGDKMECRKNIAGKTDEGQMGRWTDIGRSCPYGVIDGKLIVP